MNVENALMIPLKESHICGDIECSTISNVNDRCPRCFSETAHVAHLFDRRHATMNLLANEIAEECAKSDLESYTSYLQINTPQPIRWYNTDCPMSAGERHYVDRAVEYLDARGILIRNIDHPALVRWETAA
jgi:hypothetical protein